jgi:hypothetical protein
MDPELYHALKEKIQSLGTTAAHMTLPEGTSPTSMKNRILRVAAELNTPVTIRRVRGGLLFWHSSDEDITQAKAVAQRLQAARQPPQTHAVAPDAGAHSTQERWTRPEGLRRQDHG